MTRLEENGMVIAEINKKAKLMSPMGDIAAFQLGTIATLLGDISKSLAILADKSESKEEAEWISKDISDMVYCSKCDFREWYTYAADYNYCPKCGRKMKKEDTATWLDTHDGCMKCSNCGYELNDSYYAGNYCQNCGKKMKDNKEEGESDD